MAERLGQHNSDKTTTAVKVEPRLTFQDRLKRTRVAQKLRPVLDKLRRHNAGKRGISDLHRRRRGDIAGRLSDRLSALRAHNQHHSTSTSMEAMPNIDDPDLMLKIAGINARQQAGGP